MALRKRVSTHGMVHRDGGLVGTMRLEGSIWSDGRVVGTVQCDHLHHPLGHPVPQHLVTQDYRGPKFRMGLESGDVIEFYIGSTRGVLVNGRWLRAATDH